MASGLNEAVAFVQDPTNPNVQFIVQRTGTIRTFVNGVVGGTFLSLVGQVVSDGERGLLGLAFAPDYATSRRFFVHFNNLQGDTVIARFRRDLVNPLLADPTSRFDLRWLITVGQPQRQAFIDQPAAQNHKGGNLMFGADGNLYIGMGDGGPGNDPNHRAQTPGTYLGKMLRINVDVLDSDAEGYDVPANNPFLADPNVFPEIWAFGLRNPWKYTVDNPALGGTGALLIADVGQSAWEEINYEPAGAGGRNYGWRNREGAHSHITSLPPYNSMPLRDPFHEYSHDVDDRSITGGYVYRGQNLGAFYRGRYFYADLFGKLWSIGLVIDGSGEATVAPGSLVDHTADMDPLAMDLVTSFGEDSQGELYLVTLTGRVFKLVLGLTANGNFSNGMTGWTTFATPEPSYVVASVVSGVLEFFRLPPPPGQTNQAVVLQATGVPATADTRFVAQFDLGNSSSVRKRVTVLLHDLDFDDLTACTFWLAAGAPMRTYRMFGHATQAWGNATISFYAATPGSDGGAYRLDNVSLQPDFALSDERTDCIDPTAPAPSPGAPPGPDTVVNGGFGAGLPPWGTFGQIVWQIAGGVFEFYRPAGVPAGVVLQQTGTSVGIGANAILTATFQLGNSSGVRKRVTVLLHSADFLDLHACTFWLAPGQPLSSYSMRTFATQAWTNATVSVYPAVIDINPAIRLDDVTLRQTPGEAVLGTECIEPLTPTPGLMPGLRAARGTFRAPARRRED
jgi:glucose/arabinose dehydrogenase